MCRRAVEVGLTGIALTEHDLWWPRSEYEGLKEMFPELTILQGIEYSCPQGHFLVFLPHSAEDLVFQSYKILNLIEEVHGHHGIVIWAHPFRFDYTFYPAWLDAADLDGIEVASSNMDHPMKILAQGVARQNGIMPFENSDAHHLDTLGKYFNEIPVRLKDTEDFIDYVRRKSV
ncbi:MAG: PHP domain-containing protein [Deltaproteobacteria bacterium]|nr:MAG: PHP domain-containing protein [Deltaproteobacteria bacterium]